MEALSHLADLLGVARFYEDAFGRHRHVPEQTLRAVCSALGFAAHDDAAAESAVAELLSRRWSELGPRVVAVRGLDRPVDILVTASAPSKGVAIEWQLRDEEGATRAGTAVWQDLAFVEASPDGLPAAERRLLCIAERLPAGYYELSLTLSGRPETSTTLIVVAPQQAYEPADLAADGRVWALSTQLYSLKSKNDWGIGDFGSLAELMGYAARCGASGVGINPLHSLFQDEPERASPYSPGSRLFLNPLYINVPAVEDFVECQEAKDLVLSADGCRHLSDLRDRSLVDYRGVATFKLKILKLIYASFRVRHLGDPGDPRALAFRAFQAEHGEVLRRQATFEVLRAKLGADDPSLRYWRHWPNGLQRPDSPDVQTFIRENIEDVEYQEYLQWLADQQLGQASALARDLPIGLYCDLAIGIDNGGADAWAAQDVIVRGFSVGAPPDPWSHEGQNWGFSPLNPYALRRSGYRMFIEVVRANMRHAGALRIDHVLGLMRMFWVPDGQPTADGTYVTYPFDELLAIVILESHRRQCLVIGEDLGTLPPGLREALAAAKLYSYRLCYFEREHDGHYRRPEDYPAAAVAAVSTHDLPTLAGFWSSADIKLREKFGFLPQQEDQERAHAERDRDRGRLIEAMRATGLPADDQSDVAPRLAIHRFVARSRSRLVVVQIDDAIEEPDQINVPGTHLEYPNWQRRYMSTLAEIFADRRAQDLFAAMREERPAVASTITAGLAATINPRRRAIPTATYRLQLNSDFTFADVEKILPYLHRLGISHIYVSSFMRARPGSTHGYDVTDHGSLNPEIGDDAALIAMSETLKALDMGLVLDFVPNHMGIGLSDNAWWLDVLAWGQASAYASYFDIDWESDKRELAGKVLVPFLGDQYGRILERGELVLRFDASDGTFSIWYFEHRFPVRPRDYAVIIRRALMRGDPPGDTELAARLRGLADGFAGLRPEGLGRRRQAEIRERGHKLQSELAEFAAVPGHAAWLEGAATTFAGIPGQPESFVALHQLLERQHYRLASWRVAADEINYRRFFDINDLIGIRQENPELFSQTHRYVERLIVEDKVHGLRIDHIDGLFDPAGYCEALRRLTNTACRARNERLGIVGGGSEALSHVPIYLEKILGHHERLRADWPVDGTSGYDFLALCNRLFIRPDALSLIDAAYRQFTGQTQSLEEVLYASKRAVMSSLLASELNVLARQLDRISEQQWATRDNTFERLRLALEEIVAAFSVYRTYVTAKGCSEEDRRTINAAVSRARQRWLGPDREILDFVAAAVTTDLVKDRRSGYNRNDVIRFAMRFQQYTAPVMAKGLEDTAGYRYTRFISLNDVGSEPNVFFTSPGVFHVENRERRDVWPHAMLTTATHDTKRGEDVRMRLDAISEIAAQWGRIARRWRRFNRSKRREVDGQRVPSLTDEFLLYQTLIGSWPVEHATTDSGSWDELAQYRERIKAYLVKAMREAKVVTNWSNPNEEYEAACTAFVDAILDEREPNIFVTDLRALVSRLAFLGSLNSLSQLVLKCCSPGFPDIYRGDELWDLNLVDPDNRRPVDFAQRSAGLDEYDDYVGRLDATDPVSAATAMRDWRSGKIKLQILRRCLMLRNEYPELFSIGHYEPLRAQGETAPHIVAFTRRHGDRQVIVAVARWFESLVSAEQTTYPGAASWGDGTIELNNASCDHMVDIFTGRTYSALEYDGAATLAANDLFAILPVAVLFGSTRH